MRFSYLKQAELSFLLCTLIINLTGQNLQNLGIENKDKLLRLPEAFVIESEVDPTTYILGPGDKMGLSVLTNSNLAYILTITPSGDLWIPDMGALKISGKTIPEAEQAIIQYVRDNKFKSADVSLVLLNIRHFKIQVTGAVISPGFINVSSIERLTSAIHKSGGLHKLADEENIYLSREPKNGITCSLKSFHLNGDLVNNPILKEGDIIRVPYEDEYTRVIEESISYKQSLIFVTGFVIKPGGHTFLPGYTVLDYITLSGGISDMGTIKKISLFRNGEQQIVNTTEILKPGDQIHVPANMKYRFLGNMSILQTLTAMMTLYLTYQAAVN